MPRYNYVSQNYPKKREVESTGYISRNKSLDVIAVLGAKQNKTKQVGSNPYVLLTRQTCGQRTKKSAGSKRRAQALFFYIQICCIFLLYTNLLYIRFGQWRILKKIAPSCDQAKNECFFCRIWKLHITKNCCGRRLGKIRCFYRRNIQRIYRKGNQFWSQICFNQSPRTQNSSNSQFNCRFEKLTIRVLCTTDDSVLLCLINPRVRKIRNEAFSCPGIFSRNLRFYYLKTCHFAACFTILWTSISVFYVNTARDVVTVWLIFAKYLPL